MISRSFFCRVLLAVSSLPTFAESSSAQLLEATDPFEDLIVNNQSTELVIDLRDHFAVPGVQGQLVILDTDQGSMAFEMLGDFAPVTVENFLNYVDDGDFDETIFHRSSSLTNSLSDPARIIQAGGFTEELPPGNVSTDDPIGLEYGLLNTRGTVAMARTSAINSATSGWFVNTANNSSVLGESNGGGYAVFARIIGTGILVADAIAGLRRVNAGGAFGELPVESSFDFIAVKKEDFVAISRAYRASLFPEVEDSEAFVQFEAYSDNELIATPTLVGSELHLELGQFREGDAIISIVARDVNGNDFTTFFSLTLEQLDTPVVSLSLLEKTVGEAESTYEVEVVANATWTTSESLDWLSVSAEEGVGTEVLTITVEENTGAASRSGDIVIGGIVHAVAQLGVFELWLLDHFSEEEVSAMEPTAFLADSDGDGLGNGVERALGLDPSDSNSRLLTRVVSLGNGPHLSVTPHLNHVSYSIEESSNLIDWNEVDISELLIGDTLLYPIFGSEKDFFRLQLTSPYFEEPVGQ